MSIDPVIVLIVRFGVSWLFLAAAGHKLANVGDFRTVLAAYRIVPEPVVGVAAAFVIIVELAVGITALLQYRAAYGVAAVVLLFYAAIMAINLLRGRRFIDCGCGGAAQPLSVGLVARNVIVGVGALTALLPTLTRQLGWLDIGSIVVGSVVLGALYAATNELLAARARLEEWV